MAEMRKLWSFTGLVLAVLGFAVWALFALPAFTGQAAIREAWDTAEYWTYGIPLLLAALAFAGFVAKDAPWTLALWTATGHALATAVIAKGGTDFGLLPLAVIFVGLPLFALFTVCAWAGRWLKSRVAG